MRIGDFLNVAAQVHLFKRDNVFVDFNALINVIFVPHVSAISIACNKALKACPESSVGTKIFLTKTSPIKPL